MHVKNMNRYNVITVNSSTELNNISSAWNRLLLETQSNNVFLRWEWAYAWIKTYINNNRKLFIILVYDNTELIGVAPWYINQLRNKGLTIKQIEFLGSPEGAADYLDVFIKKGKEKEVTNCIYNYIMNEAPSLWDSIKLRDISSNSLFLLHLSNKIKQEGKYIEISNGSYCPIVSLPENYEGYLSSLSSNRREQFRRHQRLLEREGIVEHLSFQHSDIENGLKQFLDFYKEKSSYYNASIDNFLKIMVMQKDIDNLMQIDFLTLNNQKLAGLLHLTNNSSLSMYLMATDKTFNPKISIGNILVGLCIKNAIEKNLAVYDFLKGDEAYKFHWANDGKTTSHLMFYKKNIRTLIIILLDYIKNVTKFIIR